MKKIRSWVFLLLASLTSLSFASGNSFKPEIDLRSSERKIYSQNGEDGVIEKIFEVIGTTSKVYVEFGVENGVECNTRYMRERYGFNGLLMDLNNENPHINLHKEFVTAENINQLFQKYNVPTEFDLLSIDIDYNDFYLWNAIEYNPRVVVIEFNANHQPSEDKVVAYNPNHFWDTTTYFGASIMAMYKLGKAKGYSLVYAESTGVNLFFIRNDIIDQLAYTFKNINDPIKLHRVKVIHKPDHLKRPYLSADSIISQQM